MKHLLIRLATALCLFSVLVSGHSQQTSTELRVATVEREPFVVKQLNGSYSGFSVDLWDLIAQELGVTYTIVSAPAFPEMLSLVKAGEADLAIGNISVTAEREQELNFSYPVFDSGLQILVPVAGGGGGLVDAIFNWRMAGLVLLAAFVVFLIGNLMWFFEKDKAPYFQRSYKEGLWPSYWWAMHALISGGFEEHVPRSIPGRILGTALLISTLFLVSAFVATLTSAMTIAHLQSDIKSVQDLPGKRVGTTAGSTASDYLTKNRVKHRTYDDIDALFSAITTGQLDAVVHDAPVLAYFTAHAGKGVVSLTGRLFKAEKYGIALPQGSEQLESINRILLQLNENGQYLETYERWFGAEG